MFPELWLGSRPFFPPNGPRESIQCHHWMKTLVRKTETRSDYRLALVLLQPSINRHQRRSDSSLYSSKLHSTLKWGALVVNDSLAKLSPLYSLGFLEFLEKKKSQDFRSASVSNFQGLVAGKTEREKEREKKLREQGKTQANNSNSRALRQESKIRAPTTRSGSILFILKLSRLLLGGLITIYSKEKATIPFLSILLTCHFTRVVPMKMSNILFVEPPRNAIIGIDLGSFQFKENQPFHGIINIPHTSIGAVHVIHFQAINGSGNSNSNTDLKNAPNGDVDSVRYGYWFTRGNFYVTYDTDLELYIMHEELDAIKYEENLRVYSARNLLINYPAVPEFTTSQRLLKHVSWSQVKDILPVEGSATMETTLGSFRYIDSSMTTREESELLLKTIGERAGVKVTESGSRVEKTPNYTVIKFKSRAAIRDDHRMEDFLDKSYYFNDVILRRHFNMRIEKLFGELQFAFLNTILFANYGSSLQWHSIIELICKSSKVDPSYMEELDSLLSQDIDVFPTEYVDPLLNLSLWSSILNESFQGDNLVLTRRALSTKVPELVQDDSNRSNVADADADGDEGADSVDLSMAGLYGGRLYPQIDSDSDDEYKPTVAGGTYYEPRPKFY